MESIYNSYGRLKSNKLDDIKDGNRVSFSYRESMKLDNVNKNVLVLLWGIWNDGRVEFDDKKKTIVRTKEWLTLLDD
jgi:hypothetical protein